jgi:hypothetical protein
MTTYQRWFIQQADLENMTPVKARDLVCNCFLEAQKENFAEAAESLGLAPKDDDLRNTVVGAIRAAFHDIGGEYEKPTKETLSQVVAALARKSAVWGTPQAIVDHHRKQIEEVLRLLA